jgi:hypothetical protein
MVSGMHDGALSANEFAGCNGFGGMENAGGESRAATRAADRFGEVQRFEEDVRAVLSVMRPHRRERLLGWSEYRTGGAHFRATISWAPEFTKSPGASQDNPERAQLDAQMAVPRLTDVLESILVGSVKNQDDLHAAEEFEIYRGVVRELYRRLDEMQSCYE